MITFTLVFLIQSLRPIPYYDPAGRMPSNFEDYIATQVNAPYTERLISRCVGNGQNNRLILIFVNSGLYPAIQSELTTYLNDIANAGYSAKLFTISGGRPGNLRQTLQSHRDSGLVGGLMIGDLPIAWWEDSNYGEDYPLELFFTDLDGIFADNDGDGKYDSHSGNRAPEIWLGRLYASRFTYDSEERLIKAYFNRNHLYRTNQLPVPRRGLVYNEVTWYPNDHGMSNLYSNVTIFNDANITTAYHYKNQLRYGYEFIHLIAHSSPWAHTFFLANDIPGGGSVFSFEIPALAPNGAFYFLNACMCARFTEVNNLGNWYLFAQPWGLVVMASTQLMYGINDLSAIYRALSRDSCFGDAFLKWHKSNYSSFLGTCILGDPTLKVNRFRRTATSRTNPPIVQINPSAYPITAPLPWTEYIIDTSNFTNGNPVIGYSQGRVRIVFDSGRRVRSDNYMSSFDGSRFTPPESIAWHEYYDFFSTCCTDASGRFWVVWQSFRDYSTYEHFQLFSCYYYNGTWSSVRRVGPQAGYHDVQPALAAGAGDTVWCAFKSWRNGQADIWVSYAVNGGNWSTPVQLTTDSLDQIDPCITVDRENHPWVFWTSQANGRWSIQGRKYHNGWRPIFNLDTIGNNSSPRAASDSNGRIWVIWHKWQNNQSDIYYSYCEDSIWSPPAPLTTDSTDDILPDITGTQDGRVWACWQSKRNGFWDIYTSFYHNGWSRPEPVTSDIANDYDPAICPDPSGNIWITWASDRRNYWNIYAAVSPSTSIATQSITKSIGIVVTPNPFSRQVTFTGPEDFSVEIYSIDGRRKVRLNARNRVATWTPHELPHSIYLARIIGQQANSIIKLIHIK